MFLKTLFRGNSFFNNPKDVEKKTVIDADNPWYIISLKEWLGYWDLFYFLIWRDIKIIYKQTILGFSWAIIRPLFSMLVFTIIFGKLAQLDSEGIPYPIFSYVALLPWTYFSTVLTKSTNSLIGTAEIFTKVYYPRILAPLTPVFSCLVDFVIAFVVLFIMMLVYQVYPPSTILALPLVLILMVITAAGFGIWLAALAVQYRDVKHAVPFLAQLLLYLAPVAWSYSLIPKPYDRLYAIYPMIGVIEGFRACLVKKGDLPWEYILPGYVMATCVLITGLLYFRRREITFADIV
jgi:lipopolysaccharide transport system permease protein